MFKPLVVVGGILVALMPWMSGGRDALWMLVSAFALFLAGFLLLRQPGRQTVATAPLKVALITWLGWGALTLVWSVNRYQTEVWLLMALMAVAAGALAANLNQKQKHDLITGYLWIASITAAVGIFLFLTGEYGRLTSTFYWANPAAAYLIPAIFIGVWRWLQGRRLGDLVIAGVSAVGFWMTDSRGALLVVIVIAAAALLAMPNIRKIAFRLGLFVLITYVISFGFVQLKNNFVQAPALTPGSRFSEAAQGESQSTSDRLNFLKSAGAIWWDHPVGGTGAGTYGTVHPQYQQSVVSASNDAHNFYAQTLAEQGIVGAMLLGWLVLLLLLGLVRGYTIDNRNGVIVLSAIALMLHIGLDIDGRYPAILVLLAVLIGVSYQPWRRRPFKASDRWLLPLALTLTAVLAIINYQSQAWRDKGKIFDDNKQLEQAANAYKNAHSYLIYDPDNWNSEGIDYFAIAASGNKAKFDDARARANQAIQRDPQDSQHYFLLGRVEYFSGHYQEAERAYRKALALDRYNHAEYYQDLVSLQNKMGDKASAQKTVDEALNLYTDKVIENRNADENMGPAVAQLLAFRAQAELERGDKAAAKQSVERAVKLNPYNINILILKAEVEK